MEFGLFAGVMIAVISILWSIALYMIKNISTPDSVIDSSFQSEVESTPKVMTVRERLKKGDRAYYLGEDGLPMVVYKERSYYPNSCIYTYEKKDITWGGNGIGYIKIRVDENDPIFNLPEFKPLVEVSRSISTYDHESLKVRDSISVTITAVNKKVYRFKFQPETTTGILDSDYRLPDRTGVRSVVESERFQLHESSFLDKLQELKGIILKPENVLEIKYTITERPAKVTETKIVYGEKE